MAQVALFKRIQHMFNLHPAGMAEALQNKMGNRAVWCNAKMHVPTRALALSCMDAVISQLKPGSMHFQQSFYGEDVITAKYFKLDAPEIARDIKKEAEAEGLDPVEVAKFIKEALPDIILWAFSETQRILDIEEKKQ